MFLNMSSRVVSLFHKAELNDLHSKMNERYKEKKDEIKLNYIDISYDDMTKISFITDDKLARFIKDNEISEEQAKDDRYMTDRLAPQAVRNRYGTKTKIGRFIRKFFSEKEVATPTIEKLIAMASENKYAIEVVTGGDITKYYGEDYYYEEERGTLGHSCMRYDECQEYFDVYEEHASMAILRRLDSEEDKIVGRAILWDNVVIVDGDNKRSVKLMDRMYTASTEQEVIFSNWAMKNGYFFKTRQDFGTFIITSKDESIDLQDKAYIDIDKIYRTYPYMDTFAGLTRDGKLWAMKSKDREYDHYNNVPLFTEVLDKMSLRSTGGNGMIICSSCGEKWVDHQTIDISDYTNSETDLGHVCPNCMATDFVYVSGGHGFKPIAECEGLVEKCGLTKTTRLREDTVPFIYLDQELNIVEGYMAKVYADNDIHYSNVYKINGVAMDIRLTRCDVCGGVHSEGGNTIVDSFSREEAYHKGMYVFAQKTVCNSCLSIGLENGTIVDFESLPKSKYAEENKEDILRVLSDCRTSACKQLYGRPNYFFTDSMKTECVCCGKETGMFESMTQETDTYWKLRHNSVEMCPECSGAFSKNYYDGLHICGREHLDHLDAWIGSELKNEYILKQISENYILKLFPIEFLASYIKRENLLSVHDLIRDTKKYTRFSHARFSSSKAYAFYKYEQLAIAFIAKEEYSEVQKANVIAACNDIKAHIEKMSVAIFEYKDGSRIETNRAADSMNSLFHTVDSVEAMTQSMIGQAWNDGIYMHHNAFGLWGNDIEEQVPAPIELTDLEIPPLPF